MDMMYVQGHIPMKGDIYESCIGYVENEAGSGAYEG